MIEKIYTTEQGAGGGGRGGRGAENNILKILRKNAILKLMN